MAAVVASLLAAPTSSARRPIGSQYVLRLVTAEGKPIQVVFRSPLAEPIALGPERLVVDLSPNRKQALFQRTIAMGSGPSGPVSNEVFYLADVHGRGGRAFVREQYHDFFDPQPRWSRNGVRFAYRVLNRSCVGGYSYRSAAADGSDQRLIGDGVEFAWGPTHESYAIVEGGCWPPPGTGPAPLVRLVFVDRRGGRHLLASAEAERLGILAQAISPRGDLIAYETSGCRPEARLHIARTDGSGELANLRGSSTFAAWSPDGTRFAFLKPRNNGSCTFGDGAFMGALGVADARGGNRRIVARLPSAQNFSDPRAPAWAPNGRRIAYVRGYNHGLETVLPNGRGRQVVTRGSAFSFWWSRDSKRIYYDGFGR